jgi:hypothetical protein
VECLSKGGVGSLTNLFVQHYINLDTYTQALSKFFSKNKNVRAYQDLFKRVFLMYKNNLIDPGCQHKYKNTVIAFFINILDIK